MAGTLTISTLSDGTNSTSSTNCIQGSAKAWANFNGTSSGSITPRASYNVSSVTKNSTANYTVNFTNAFVDTNYCAQILGVGTSSLVWNSNMTYSTTSFTYALVNTSGSTGSDFQYQNVVFFR